MNKGAPRGWASVASREVGEALRRTWQASGMSHAELVRRSGYCERTVCRVMAGKGASVASVQAIAGALGVDLVVDITVQVSPGQGRVREYPETQERTTEEQNRGR